MLLVVHLEADLLQHVHAMLGGPGLNEGPVEPVAVVGDVYGRLDFPHVIEPAPEHGLLVGHVPHREGPCMPISSWRKWRKDALSRWVFERFGSLRGTGGCTAR